MSDVVTYILILGLVVIPAYLFIIKPSMELLQAVYVNQSVLVAYPMP